MKITPKKRAQFKKIAKERIDILFDEARAIFNINPKRSTRYIFLARKLAMKYNVSLTSEQRRQYCHDCYNYLLPGSNCKVRTNPKTKAVEYYCQSCGKINRFGYSKEKSK